MNQQVAAILTTWPKEPQESAKRLIESYGEQQEYTPSQLIWYHTKDGWKRTVLTKEEIPHNFPCLWAIFVICRSILEVLRQPVLSL